MSRYTLELRFFKKEELFDFTYDFFDDNLKDYFEESFYNYFYFREIGYPTVERFKKELQTTLNLIHNYYKEYYKTTKQVEIEEFMVTKDATDEFTREYESIGNSNSTLKNLSTSNGTNNGLNKFFDTPRNKINLEENALTNVNLDEIKTNGTTEDNSENANFSNNKIIEKTTLHSKGDLGVTSSGFLIEGWRNSITNIFQMMFDELESLFFGLF